MAVLRSYVLGLLPCQASLLLQQTPASSALVTTRLKLPCSSPVQKTFVVLGSKRGRGLCEGVQPSSPGSDGKEEYKMAPGSPSLTGLLAFYFGLIGPSTVVFAQHN